MEALRYVRVFFPVDAAPEDRTAANALPRDNADFARTRLQGVVSALAGTEAENHRAIAAQLAPLGIPYVYEPGRLERAPVRLWEKPGIASLGTDGAIHISHRTIRGFLAGSLREAAHSQSREGLMFSVLLGLPKADPTRPLEKIWYIRLFGLLEMLEASAPVIITPTLLDEVQSLIGERVNAAEWSEGIAFDQLAAEVSAGSRTPSPAGTYVMISTFFLFSEMIAAPSERFLLAHELGHLALNHHADDTLDCQGRHDRERAADAFAIALLTYSSPGDIETTLTLWGGGGRHTAPEPGRDTTEEEQRLVSVGFPQAFRYGLAEAELSLEGTEGCLPEAPHVREAHALELWRRMVSRRLDALSALTAYSRAHPVLAATRQVASPWSAAEEQAFADDARQACHGAPVVVVHAPAQMDPRLRQYSAVCRQPVPPEEMLAPEAKVLIGAATFDLWRSPYLYAASLD